MLGSLTFGDESAPEPVDLGMPKVPSTIPAQKVTRLDEFINELFYQTGGNINLQTIRLQLAGITDRTIDGLVKQAKYDYISVARQLNILEA